MALSSEEVAEINAIMSLCDVIGDDITDHISNILREHFGFEKLKPLQHQIVKAVINDNQDVLAVMATGYGKSLCYQLPALLKPGVVIVISPLIALMQDQVISLRLVNISACLLSPTLNPNAMSTLKQEIMAAKYKIVYITPEYAIRSGSFLSCVNKSPGIILLAIDEAHCVSRWGHDFRVAYRQLGDLRLQLPKVPFMAVTATATLSVRQDISRSLCLQSPLFVSSSVDRKNLYLGVSLRSQNPVNDLFGAGMLSETFNKNQTVSFDGSTIIYCRTKVMTELVFNNLKEAGLSVSIYHAGLGNDARTRAQIAFMNDECQVIVATIAFGMGIDKPDIRNVVHYGAPRDMDSYYQEIGRGGRDGQRCRCHAFYDKQDLALNRRLIVPANCDGDKEYTKHQFEMQKKMSVYLTTMSCRRRIILEHFGESLSFADQTEFCCDNCSRGPIEPSLTSEDVTKEARILFSAIEALGGRYGLVMYVQFVRGSTSSRISDRMRSMLNYGTGRNIRSEQWWKEFGRKMIDLGYLDEIPIQGVAFGACSIGISSLGRQWMSTNQSMLVPSSPKNKKSTSVLPINVTNQYSSTCILPQIIVNERPWANSSFSQRRVVQASHANNEDEAKLYAALIRIRNKLAAESGIPAHRIANNKSIASLARKRPSQTSYLSQIEEFPLAKAETVGRSFVDFINQFCAENDLSTNVSNSHHAVQSSNEMFDYGQLERSLNRFVTEKQRSIYRRFQIQKESIDQMESRSEAFECLVVAMTHQLPVDIERLNVNERMIDQVEKCVRQNPVCSNIGDFSLLRRTIKDAQLNIGEEELRFILSVLKLKYGMTVCSSQQRSDRKMEVSKKRLPGWMSCSSPPECSITKPPSKKKGKLKF